MCRHVVVLSVAVVLTGHSPATRSASTPPTQTPPLTTSHTRVFTPSFTGTEISIEVQEGVGNPEVSVTRLGRRTARKDPLVGGVTLSKVASAGSRTQTFRLDRAFSGTEIVPLEITVAALDEDSDPLSAIVYAKPTADGKIIETTWAEYACAEKLYACGKDWRGRPAMRLSTKR